MVASGAHPHSGAGQGLYGGLPVHAPPPGLYLLELSYWAFLRDFDHAQDYVKHLIELCNQDGGLDHLLVRLGKELTQQQADALRKLRGSSVIPWDSPVITEGEQGLLKEMKQFRGLPGCGNENELQQVLVQMQDTIEGVPDLITTLCLLEYPKRGRRVNQNPPPNFCCVCLEREKDTLLSPCGHKAFCSECATSLQRRTGVCPICRTAIRDVIRVYE
jgi:hypothetical protein